MKAVRGLYDQGVNIMAFFREAQGTAQNSLDAILVSYDLQSGSYSKSADDPEHREKLEAFAIKVAAVMDPLEGESLLEVGVGEATTLCHVAEKLQRRPPDVWGIDLSWSRIAYARDYASRFPQPPPVLSTGDMFQLPFADNSFDIVFTSHAIEPNHGREHEALRELYRVTRRWLVLLEPTYELGNEETRQRIERHGYCRNLPAIARELGYTVAEHRLFDTDWVNSNQTGLLLIEKPDLGPGDAPRHACPRCHRPFAAIRGNYFCEDCLSVYPILEGIPCLLPGNGILASKFPSRVAPTS